MHITIPKRVISRMSPSELEICGRHESNVKGLERLTVDLTDKAAEDVDFLVAAFERMQSEGSHQTKGLLATIDRWRKILAEEGAGQARPQTLREFSDLLAQYIRTAPGHRVYRQLKDTNTWVGFFFNYVEYHPESRDRHGHHESAYVETCLMHWELGEERGHYINFHSGEADSRTVAEALAEKGYIIETPELRDAYRKSDAKFNRLVDAVGTVVRLTGAGMTLRDSSWDREVQIPMIRDGGSGVGVIDVVTDPDNDREQIGGERGVRVRPNFWASKNPKSLKPVDSDDLPGNTSINEGKGALDDPGTMPEIPVHPFVIVNHLGFHQRFKVHVDEMADYKWDDSMGDNLILPDVTKNLVNTLVSQGRIEFADIVAGKGNGICVLLGGPPGVGKTLTAEVFAQATKRPLLSVQAAQLGIDAQNIESNLSRILRRGSRWNAVVLLDEADVYIAERGRGDLTQNAIVAAFLRILERHTATIFMTTNHIENVDDAVASRCIARIDYEPPSVESQKEIWKVLDKLNGTGLTEDDIEEITSRHPDLTGRDIKQMLNLAALWSANHQEPVSPKAIDFVRQFLPTRAPPVASTNGNVPEPVEGPGRRRGLLGAGRVIR